MSFLFKPKRRRNNSGTSEDADLNLSPEVRLARSVGNFSLMGLADHENSGIPRQPGEPVVKHIHDWGNARHWDVWPGAPRDHCHRWQAKVW